MDDHAPARRRRRSRRKLHNGPRKAATTGACWRCRCGAARQTRIADGYLKPVRFAPWPPPLRRYQHTVVILSLFCDPLRFIACHAEVVERCGHPPQLFGRPRFNAAGRPVISITIFCFGAQLCRRPVDRILAGDSGSHWTSVQSTGVFEQAKLNRQVPSGDRARRQPPKIPRPAASRTFTNSLGCNAPGRRGEDECGTPENRSRFPARSSKAARVHARRTTAALILRKHPAALRDVPGRARTIEAFLTSQSGFEKSAVAVGACQAVVVGAAEPAAAGGQDVRRSPGCSIRNMQ
jgi:hypothetical protein